MRLVIVAIALALLACVDAQNPTFVDSAQEVYAQHPKFVARLDPQASASNFQQAAMPAPIPIPNALPSMPSLSNEFRFAQANIERLTGPEPASAKEGGAAPKTSSCSAEEHDCDSQDQVAEDEARNSHLASSDDSGEKDKQLQDALQQVKDEIVQKATQIKSEKHWVTEVTKITEAYVKKTRRVNANIREMQAAVKDLFRKKKQIENLMLQRKLESKLRVANEDLNTLKSALTNVKKKETAFVKSKKDIRSTIGAIEDQLTKLRGDGKPEAGKEAPKKE